MQCDDDSYPEDCYVRTWEVSSDVAGFFDTSLLTTPQNEFYRIAQIQGRIWDIAPEMPGLLRCAAFENVQYTPYALPIGAWPKDPKLKKIGKWFRVQLADGAIEGYSLALFTRYGQWKPSEVQVLLAQVRGELNSNKMHLYSQ